MKKKPLDVPPCMLSPDGMIVVSDENIDKLFDRVSTDDEVREARARLDALAKELDAQREKKPQK